MGLQVTDKEEHCIDDDRNDGKENKWRTKELVQ